MINKNSVFLKFGDYYTVNSNTFKMGIDRRITKKIAERFKGKKVLETCTGGGFTTISLAETAEKVITIEITKKNRDQAMQNVEKAGFIEKVEFILDDCRNDKLLNEVANVDAAFLDPDWDDKGGNHIYKFIGSNTRPPSDELLNKIMKLTPNIALILPPFIPEDEFTFLPSHEFQKIYLENELALFCLYFGNLMKKEGNTVLQV